MKKLNLKLLLIPFLLILFSCSKNELTVDDVNNTVKDLDYTKINVVSAKNGTMLSFDNWGYFSYVVSVLAEQTNVHIQNYIVPLDSQGIIDDELTDKIALDGFNSFQPLHTFNNTLGFVSFFQVAEQQEIIWLNNSVDLDINQDPFYGVEIFQSALLNTDGEVMIGGEVFKKGVSSSSSSCKVWDSKSAWSSVFSFNGKSRRLKAWIGISPGTAQSSTKSYYKTKKGNWALWFANKTTTNVYGTKRSKLINGDCSDLNTTLNTTASSIIGFYAFTMSSHSNMTSSAILNEYTVKSNHGAATSGAISLNY